MVWRTVLLMIVFYFLALFQSSFFIHFAFFGFTLNLILILVILITLFFADLSFGLASAVAGGFFWDVFSQQPFGWHVLILLASALFIHFVFKKYVRYPLG